MDDQKEPEYLTLEEMAKVLRVAKIWVYQRTRKGQSAIPHLRLGRHIRFDKKKVLDFFEAAEKAPK